MNEQQNSNNEVKEVVELPKENGAPTKELIAKNPDAFNSKEQVLFQKAEEKESNPIGVLLIVIVLIATIFCLPLIYNFFNPEASKENGGDIEAPDPVLVPDKIYTFEDSNLRVEVNKLEFSNFVKTENNGLYDMTFTLINNDAKPYLFDKNIYIIFYDGSKEIYHALVHSYTPLAATSSIEMSVGVSKRVYSSGNGFKIKEVKEDAYPKVKLEKQEDNFDIISCDYNNDLMVYYFKNRMLYKIKENYSTDKESNEYFYYDDRNKYYGEYLEIKDIKGIDAHYIQGEVDDYFSFQADIALNTIDNKTVSDLEIYKYFKFNESPEVISYEMEALGYTCG